MNNDIKKLIEESLKDQKSIFGDDLLGIVEPNSEKMVVTKNPEESVDELKNDKKAKLEKQYTADEGIKVVKEEIPAMIESFQKSTSLDDLYKNINECKKCALGETRNKFVFGVGNPNADAMLIGEAPGADEDQQGEPFVGKAGKLLNDILKAIKFERDEVYIANILKCRPPNNRDPLPEEMTICRKYLEKQLDLIKPKVILCLGRIAATTLLNQNVALGKLREEVHEMNGIKVMATYHPAALLRNPNWKRGCWEDVQKFRKLYDELSGNQNG